MSAATGLLTGFLLSPLTQGAITYPTRSFEAGSGPASVARSESYSHPTPYETLDTREKQAIQSGIYHPVSSAVPHLQPLCSSGDCQWRRNISSLAVCNAVADISDRLTVSNQASIPPGRRPGVGGDGTNDGNSLNEPVYEGRLPNGLFLVGSNSTCNLNISWAQPTSGGSTNSNNPGRGGQEESFLPARTSLAFSERDGRVLSAIANFFVVYTTTNESNPTTGTGSPRQGQAQGGGGRAGTFRAVEVLFHFCVNTYKVSTSRGMTTSTVVHSSTLAAAQDESATSSSGVANVRPPSPSRRIFLRSASGNEVYSVKRDDVRFLNAYIRSLFTGTYSRRYGQAIGRQTATSEALGLAMFQGGSGGDDSVRDVVGNLTANVAISLTNTIRAMSSASEPGTVLATESYVRVQWAWLSFLAVQVVLSVSFLLGIMIQTAVWNVKILKGSSMAALLAISADDKAYLEEREHVLLDASHSGDEGAETTRKLRAITCRFRPRERGWNLDLGKREDG